MRVLLEQRFANNPRAMEYLDSLHPSVRQMVIRHADQIRTQEDLIALANRYMDEALSEVGGIYDDSDTYPN